MCVDNVRIMRMMAPGSNQRESPMPSPKSAESSVIKFSAQPARGRRRVGKRPDHPDADLIEHCIEYAMQISAGRVAYMVDPTDAKFASYCDDLAKARGDRAMNAILDIEPVTVDGV